MDNGYYSLLIRLHDALKIDVGALGEYLFPAGFYIYAGSARKNLKARISRHQRKKKKKLHWHIDYLLAQPEARIQDVYTYPLSSGDECSLIKKLKKAKGSKVIVPGFGSSDCKKHCGSHLIYFPQLPDLRKI
jgi:Uri superfamily endonuclease